MGTLPLTSAIIVITRVTVAPVPQQTASCVQLAIIDRSAQTSAALAPPVTMAVTLLLSAQSVQWAVPNAHLLTLAQAAYRSQESITISKTQNVSLCVLRALSVLTTPTVIWSAVTALLPAQPAKMMPLPASLAQLETFYFMMN